MRPIFYNGFNYQFKKVNKSKKTLKLNKKGRKYMSRNTDSMRGGWNSGTKAEIQRSTSGYYSPYNDSGNVGVRVRSSFPSNKIHPKFY